MKRKTPIPQAVAWRLPRLVACRKTMIATAAAITHAARKAGAEMVPGIGARTVARSDRARLVAAHGDGGFREVQAGVASLFLSCEVGVDVATKKQKTRASAAGKDAPAKVKPKKKTSRGK